MQFSYYMSMWVPDRFIHIAIALAGLWYFRSHPAFRKTLPIVLTTLVALTTMALAEILSVKFLLQLQLARCSYFLFILLTFFLANFIMRADKPCRKISHVFWFILGFALMIESPVGDPHNPIRWILLIAGTVTVIFIIGKKPQWWKQLYIGTGVGMVLLATTITVFDTYQTNRNRYAKEMKKSVGESSEKLKGNAHYFLFSALYDKTFTTPWEEVQLWCRYHIPEDEVIMTPMYLEGFRSFSRRSIYGSYKDGAPHNYSEATFFRWWKRMRRLGVDVNVPRGDFPRLYHRNAEAVARQEGIRYLVYDKQIARSHITPLFENERFAVVDLHQATRPLLELK